MVRPLNRILNSSSFTKWLRSIKKDNFEVTMYDGYIKEDLNLELKSMTDINLRYITQDSKLAIDEILSLIDYCDYNAVRIGYMGQLNMIEELSKLENAVSTTCVRCGRSNLSNYSELCPDCNYKLLLGLSISKGAELLRGIEEGNVPRVNNLDAYI